MGERWLDDLFAAAAVLLIASAIARPPSCLRVRRLRSGTVAVVRLRGRS